MSRGLRLLLILMSLALGGWANEAQAQCAWYQSWCATPYTCCDSCPSYCCGGTDCWGNCTWWYVCGYYQCNCRTCYSYSCRSVWYDNNNCGGCDVRCGSNTCCGFSCKNLQYDNSNCGSCGNVCPAWANTCCAGGCRNLQWDNSHCGACNNACSGGRTCQNGSCVCGPNQAWCGTPVYSPGYCCDWWGCWVCYWYVSGYNYTCRNIVNDNANCGGCDINCGSNTCCGTTCKNLQTDPNNCGACYRVCSGAANTCCAAGCRNLQTDNSHCGSCGNACTGGRTCVSGSCVCKANEAWCGTPVYSPGYCCDWWGCWVCYWYVSGYNYACRNVVDDNNNCGGCDVRCSSGWGCCGRTCRNLQSDNNNCGACYRVCSGAANTCCAAGCRDLQTDNNHCGSCGNVCTGGRTCQAGKCVCKPNEEFCGTPNYSPSYCCDWWGCWVCGWYVSSYSYACRNVVDDNNNCGGCDVRCSSGWGCCGRTCRNLQSDNSNCGQCYRVCSGVANTCCAAGCRDLQTDNSHCGSCGNACTGGRFCQAGKCVCKPNEEFCGTPNYSPSYCCDWWGCWVCGWYVSSYSYACRNVVDDNNNCGGCDVRCAAGGGCCYRTCRNFQTDNNNCGRCYNVCSGATNTCCAAGCRNLQTDNNHCGSCGNVCTGGRFCQAGKCVCKPNEEFCGTPNYCPSYCCDWWGCWVCGWYVCSYSYACRNVVDDNNNCGNCDVRCNTGGGQQCCGRTCKNLQTDNSNCGRCYNVCSGVANTCCAGGCRDLQTDNNHCGSCGNVCTGGRFCSAGKCVCKPNEEFCGTPNYCPQYCCDWWGCWVCGWYVCSYSYACRNVVDDNNNCGGCDVRCNTGGGEQCCGRACRNLRTDNNNCGQCNKVCSGAANTCCASACRDLQTDNNNCGSCGKVCSGAANTCCAGGCRNLQTDNNHCGACGKVCSGAANTCCASSCRDTQTDNNHCGACGNVCTGGKFCSGGKCVCPTGQTDCNGICRNLQNDASNCGSCGNVCPASANTCCSGSCKNLQTDASNCGSCGLVCTGGKTCQGGVCKCPSGLTDCNGVCKNLQTDATNCGTCANVCPASANTCCSGACRNLQTDSSNCGSCGNVCTGGKTCQSGACKCPAGLTDCNGVCKNLQTDSSNCGTCGNACVAGKICKSGVCECPDGSAFCGTPYDCNCSNYSCNCRTNTVCNSYTCCNSYPCCSSYTCCGWQTSCYTSCWTSCACWWNCYSYCCSTDCWGNCNGWCSSCSLSCSCWTSCGTVCNSYYTCGTCTSCGTCQSCSTCTSCNPVTTCDTCTKCDTCYNYSCRNVTNDDNNCGGCDIKCSSGTKCCGTACRNLQTDNNNCGSCGTVCTGGKTCQAGACKCPAGRTDCNGTCKDLNADATACGACTTNCVTNLGSGGICCSASCKDSQTDNNNCGSCGNVCTGGKTCQAGACKCPSGLTDCNGTCKNLNTDATACGSCATNCVTNLGSGGICCSASCKDKLSDANNCGGCGVVCTGGMTCQGGSCKCPAGQTDCGGICKNLQTDSAHCGACNNACASDRYCSGGKCLCNAPLSDCNGACRNLQTDSYNCGACDNFCTGGKSCVAGACKCPPGTADCDGVCVDILADKNNCGSCGNVCRDSKMVCSSGTCTCTNSCTSPYVLNPYSCDCQCKVSCPGGQIVNAETCACESATCKQKLTSDKQVTFATDNFSELESIKIVGTAMQLQTDAIKLDGNNIKLNKDQELTAVYVQDSGSSTQSIGYLYYADLIKRGYIDTKGTVDSSDDALHDKNANGIADFHEDLFNLAPRTGADARPYVGLTPRCSATFSHGGKTYSAPELAMQGCTVNFYSPGAADESASAASAACSAGSTTCLRDMRTSKWTTYIRTSQLGADVAPPNWNTNIYNDKGLFPTLPNLLEPPVDENRGLGLGNVLFLITDDDTNTATTNNFGTGTFTRLDGTTFTITDNSGVEEGRPDYDATAYEASGEPLDPADNPEPGLGEADRQREMGTVPGGKELVFFQVGYGRSAHNTSTNGTMSYPCLKYAKDGHCTLHMATPINVAFSKPFLNLDMNARPEDPVMVRNAGVSNATTATITAGTLYRNSSRAGWLESRTLTRLNTLAYGFQTLPRDAVVVNRHAPAGATPKVPHVAAYSPVTDPFRWFLGFEDLTRADSTRDYNDVVLIINKANGGVARSEVMTKDITSGLENEFSVTKVRLKRDDDKLRKELGTGNWTETDTNACLGPPEADITYAIALDCRICDGSTGNCRYNETPTWYDLEWTSGQSEQTLDMADLGLLGSQLCWKVTIDSPRDECLPRVYNVDVGYEALRAGQYSRSQLIPLANAVSFGTFEQSGPAWNGVAAPKPSVRSYSNRQDVAVRGHLFLNQLYDPADPKKSNAKVLWDAGDVLAKYVNGTTNPDGRTLWTVSASGTRMSLGTEITTGTRAFPTGIYTARIGTKYVYDLNSSHSQRRRADANDRAFFRDWMYGWEDRLGAAGSVFDDCITAGDCKKQTAARRAWPLGGVRLSTPAVVTPPMTPPWLKRSSTTEQSLYAANFQSKLTTRDSVAYVGAMDGMLHAFATGQYRSGDDPCTGFVDYRGYFKGNTCTTRDYGTGSELFAYAPAQLLPRYLRMYVPDARANTGSTITTSGTQMGYLPKQQATVDATASFADMDFGITGQPAWTIDTTGSRTAGAKTVLAMATGPALNTVFALDVTDPSSANYPLPLWEASLGFPASGEFTTLTGWRTRSPAPALWPTSTGTRHAPTMVRANVGGTVGNKWVTVFPTDFSPSSSSYAGTVYLFDTKAGTLLADGSRIIGIVPLEKGEGVAGEVVGADVDGDGNYDVLYVASTSGKIFRINLGIVSAVAAPDRRLNVCVVADGAATLASKGLLATQAALQDVYSAPAINVLRDGTPRVRFFFGSGNNPDTAVDIQATNYYLFGFEDTAPLSATCTAAKALWQYKLDPGQNVWGGVSLNTDSVFAITATGNGADACNLGLEEGRFYSVKQSPDATGNAQPNVGNGQTIGGQGVAGGVIYDEQLLYTTATGEVKLVGSATFNNAPQGGNTGTRRTLRWEALPNGRMPK